MSQRVPILCYCRMGSPNPWRQCSLSFFRVLGPIPSRGRTDASQSTKRRHPGWWVTDAKGLWIRTLHQSHRLGSCWLCRSRPSGASLHSHKHFQILYPVPLPPSPIQQKPELGGSGSSYNLAAPLLTSQRHGLAKPTGGPIIDENCNCGASFEYPGPWASRYRSGSGDSSFE